MRSCHQGRSLALLQQLLKEGPGFQVQWGPWEGHQRIRQGSVEAEMNFSTLLFHPHQEAHCLLFSSLSVARMVSAAYLRLLIFLLAIFIVACDSSSLGFHRMYSTYKLNKQGDKIQPGHTLFPVVNLSTVPCSLLTVAS